VIPKYSGKDIRDMRKQARASSETTVPPGLGKEMGTQLTAPINNLLENIGLSIVSLQTRPAALHFNRQWML